MTYENVIEMLEEAGLPLAYDHFAEGESPEPPFLIFLFPGTDNVFADESEVWIESEKMYEVLYQTQMIGG